MGKAYLDFRINEAATIDYLMNHFNKKGNKEFAELLKNDREFRNQIVKYIGTPQNTSLSLMNIASSTSNAYKKVMAKYNKSSDSIWNIVKELPNPFMPTASRVSITDPKVMEDAYVVSLLPGLVNYLRAYYPNLSNDELKVIRNNIVNYVERPKFQKLRDDVRDNQKLLKDMVNVYEVSNTNKAECKQIADYLKELLDPEKSWVMASLSHNRVFGDLNDKETIKLIQNALKKDIALAGKVDFETWKQTSEISQLFNYLNNVGRPVQIITDFIHARKGLINNVEELKQTALDYLDPDTVINYKDPEVVVLTSKKRGSGLSGGQKYDTSIPRDYDDHRNENADFVFDVTQDQFEGLQVIYELEQDKVNKK